MAKKNKRIYDDDGISVYEEVKVEKEEETPAVGKRVSLSDFVTSLSAYTIPQINTMELGSGECVICHKETNSEDRKICLDCMKKYKNALLKQTKRVLADEMMDI